MPHVRRKQLFRILNEKLAHLYVLSFKADLL